MRALRVPRDGGMILTMLVALMGIALLPVVFMAALSASADTHPHSTRQTLRAMTQPLVHGVERAIAYVRDR